MAPKIDYSDLYLDPEKTVLTLNNEPFVSGTKLSTEKDYKLFVSVSDLAGNTTARTIIFTLDKTEPVIKFENNINGKYLKENIIPKFVIDDMTDYDIVSMTLDGKDYDAKTEITQEGKHVLFLEVKDKAGNKSSLSVEFILDKTSPKVIYTSVIPVF